MHLVSLTTVPVGWELNTNNSHHLTPNNHSPTNLTGADEAAPGADDDHPVAAVRRLLAPVLHHQPVPELRPVHVGAPDPPVPLHRAAGPQQLGPEPRAVLPHAPRLPAHRAAHGALPVSQVVQEGERG